MAAREVASGSPPMSPIVIRSKSEPITRRIEELDDANDSRTTRSDGGSPASVTPLPPVKPVTNYPPSARDWENHRRIFTQLYSVENKTLDQVMKIMKNEYGFKATPRMFKQRVKDWDLHKNYKAAERKELAQIVTLVKYHEVMGESRPRQVLLRGKPVKMHKLRRDLRNQNLSSRRISEFQDLAQGIRSIPGQEVAVEDLRKRMMISTTPSSPLTSPALYRDVEMLLKYTDLYYQSVTVDHFPRLTSYVVIPPSRDFVNNVDIAFELFKSGRPAKGIQLLNETSGHAQAMFQKNCPETLSNFVYNAADWTLDVPPEVFNLFWKFITAMAATVLGEEHPVSMVCNAIGKLERGSIAYAKAFEVMMKRLETILGPEHNESISTKDRYAVLLCWAGQYEQAEKLHRNLVDYYDSKDKLSHDAISCFYRLGRIMERAGKLKDAEIVYRETLARRDVSPSCKSCPSYVHSAVIVNLVDLLINREEFNESEELLKKTLVACLELDIGDTVRIVSKLESLLVSLDRTDEADELRLQYPAAF